MNDMFSSAALESAYLSQALILRFQSQDGCFLSNTAQPVPMQLHTLLTVLLTKAVPYSRNRSIPISPQA